MANGNGNGGNGNGYINGNGAAVLTPTKVLVTCLTLTMMINGYTLTQIDAKTEDRYTSYDAARDLKYIDQRFQAIEKHDDKCELKIDAHLRGHAR